MEENRPREGRGGGDDGGGARQDERERGELVAWRWSDYTERKGTSGRNDWEKEERRMRKAALLGERRGRVKMAERERVKSDTSAYCEIPPFPCLADDHQMSVFLHTEFLHRIIPV